jgi:hypothetical protein
VTAVGTGRRKVGQEGLHAPVDVVAEGPHRLQVVTGEVQLPVLLVGGGPGQGRATGVPAHRDDEVSGATNVLVIGLGVTSVRGMPPFGERGDDGGVEGVGGVGPSRVRPPVSWSGKP